MALGMLAGCWNASRGGDPLAGFRVTGDARKCVTSYRIEDTRVLDDSRILFRLGREEYYVNRLARSCAGLKLAQGFAYDLRGGSAICRGDVIIGLDGTTTGRPCLLGEFEKVVRDSSR